MKCKECNLNEVPAYRKSLCDDCAKKKAWDYENRDKQAPQQVSPVVSETVNLDTPKPESKFNAMYVSYAKDIFVASLVDVKVHELDENMSTDIMRMSINLVKQARIAFE